MAIYFTSDHHFGHTRICEYAGRPFQSLEEMNEILIANWNDLVRPGDTVYHLGDFAFVRPDEVKPLVKRLMGQIHLVRGNHDRFLKEKNRDFGFAWVGEYKEIKVGDQKIVLCHYPFLTWSGRHRGTWDLHGHSHGSLPVDPGSKRMDIGVDAIAQGHGKNRRMYAPIEYSEVEQVMSSRTISPVDHHERRGGDDDRES